MIIIIDFFNIRTHLPCADANNALDDCFVDTYKKSIPIFSKYSTDFASET